MKRMLIIKDYQGCFWATFPKGQHQSVSLDTTYMLDYFSKVGYSVDITTYAGFIFASDYKGVYVLYGSSEDPIGGTKDYIEDLLLWLRLQGAILIPDFIYFRAHHNKVFMELLRQNFNDVSLKMIESQTFRSPEDMKAGLFKYPLVLKASAGSGSSGVCLINNEKQLFKKAKSISRIPSLRANFLGQLRWIKRKLDNRDPPPSRYNNKFVIQSFIPNLTGDYKVLVFKIHYFVLHRQNRKNDFRASGGGRFIDIDKTELPMILDFARLCKQEISAPCLSLDIAYDGNTCHLLEFQCISFGFKAMSWAENYYEHDDIQNKWITVDANVNPEQEFCDSVKTYIDLLMQ